MRPKLSPRHHTTGCCLSGCRYIHQVEVQGNCLTLLPTLNNSTLTKGLDVRDAILLGLLGFCVWHVVQLHS